MPQTSPRSEPPAPVVALFPTPHFLSCADLNRVQAERLIESANSFVALNRSPSKKLDLLAGRTLMNLFFENSTRTQSSFELAGRRLGADVLNMSPRTSSIAKGETLIDTAVTLNAMKPDLLVVRHGASGAASLLSQKVRLRRGQRGRRPARAPHPGPARRPDALANRSGAWKD